MQNTRRRIKTRKVKYLLLPRLRQPSNYVILVFLLVLNILLPEPSESEAPPGRTQDFSYLGSLSVSRDQGLLHAWLLYHGERILTIYAQEAHKGGFRAHTVGGWRSR